MIKEVRVCHDHAVQLVARLTHARRLPDGTDHHQAVVPVLGNGLNYLRPRVLQEGRAIARICRRGAEIDQQYVGFPLLAGGCLFSQIARLCQQQNKTTEATNLLAPISAWFTEGFATKDLLEAKALLEELSAPELVKS